MITRVKICGITRIQDAQHAVESGADALGFMFYPASKRHIDFSSARKIIQSLPSFVTRVGVMVNPSEDEVDMALEVAGVNCLQFHGEEPPESITRYSVPVIKAFRVKDSSSLDQLEHYSSANAFLLDSFVPGAHGGTGHTFNWDLVQSARKFGKNIILAGGLNPENVGRAIQAVQPYALDVSSGVESMPGVKDPALLEAFMSQVRLHSH
ncbi:MAG: phosphoribosylanthranilate isomerase [Verrucomicrobia bacterium]|nr:phosphoribosylanthranilate isomerase [Verrucomicrobiota bacterium]